MNQSSNYKILPFTYIIAAILLFFAINLVSSVVFNRFQLDLTEDNLYSLSDGTKTILKDINEPITLRFFFSNKVANGIPALKTYAARIKGLLAKYESHSNDNITVKFIDPEPFSDDEDLAISYGLSGADLEGSGVKLYFGMVASNSVDDSRAIPFFPFDSEKFLEYDITRMIYDLSNPKRPVLGLLSSIPMDLPYNKNLIMSGETSWALLEQINQIFDIKIIDPKSTGLPGHIDVLMVVHPTGLGSDLLFAIDQYVLQGKKALFFVDPYAENSQLGEGRQDSVKPMANIMESWGVSVKEGKVIGDRRAAITVSTENGESIDYLTHLNLRGNNLNPEDILTSELKSINTSSIGSIQKIRNSKLILTPLIQSNTRSAEIAVDILKRNPDPKALLADFEASNKQYILAAKVTGEASSAFKNRKEGQLNSSKNPMNIIVIADTDMLRDYYWVKIQNVMGYAVTIPHADNGALVVNALDYLSGSPELISLRRGGTSSRPFEVVHAIQKEAEEHYLLKEKELQKELAVTESRLFELQNKNDGNRLTFTEEEQREISRSNYQMLALRKDLRNVQQELRKDIESLGSTLKLLNISSMAILVTVFAVIFFIRKTKYSRVVRRVKP